MSTAREVKELIPGHYYRIPSQDNVVAQYVGTGVIVSADRMCCRETIYTDKLNGLYYP